MGGSRWLAEERTKNTWDGGGNFQESIECSQHSNPVTHLYLSIAFEAIGYFLIWVIEVNLNLK